MIANLCGFVSIVYIMQKPDEIVTQLKVKKLTLKEQRFCDEYLIDGNASRAAIAAGYSAKAAKEIGSRLLTRANVKQYVTEKQGELREKLEITQERVLSELAKVAFANMGDFSVWDKNNMSLKNSGELTKDQTAAVAEVANTKFGAKLKLHDKVSALEKLAKHLGLIDQNSDKPIKIDINMTPEQAAAAYKKSLSECK